MTESREWAFVALGSNIGDREQHLAFAREALRKLADTELRAASEIEETEAIGSVEQGPYLNQMVVLHTAIDPHELLQACLNIEASRGRIRSERWGPRTLDLDIVRYGDRTIDSPRLTVPHPEIENRPFWQRELHELEEVIRHDVSDLGADRS